MRGESLGRGGIRRAAVIGAMLAGLGAGTACAGEETVEKMAEEKVEGTWAGEFKVAGIITLPCSLRLARVEGGGLEGFMNVPAQVLRMPLTEIRFEPPALRFVAGGSVSFEGKVEGHDFSGSLTQGPMKGTFSLRRLFVRWGDTASYDGYTGTYGAGRDAVTVLHEGDFLIAGDRELFPAEGELFCAVTDARPHTPLTCYAFLRGPDGRIDRVEVGGLGDKRGEGRVLARQPDAFLRREVRFRNGDVSLSGTLYLPLGKGLHPAFAMVHGSGAAGRRMFDSLGAHFASKGIAMLAYDKRGVGCSTGDWMRASHEDLAGDALAAVAALRGAAGVDPSRVGLCGISQGGWIIPIACSRSKDVAFAVLLSAPAVTGRQQFVTRTRRTLEAAGFPQESVEAALALADLLLRAAVDESLRPGLKKEIERCKGEKWFRAAIPLDTQPLDAVFAQLHSAELDRDPAPALERTLCPVLAIYGGADTGVPPDENKPAMEAAFRRGGNRDFAFKVYDGADHGLQMPDRRTAPGLLEDIAEWILKRKGESR